MHLEQIDPQHTPERFFLPDPESARDILDDNGKPTGEKEYNFTLSNLDVSDEYQEGKVLRRKSEKGVQELHVYDDCIKLYETVDGVTDLIATSKIYGEVDNAGKWERIDFGDCNVNTYDLYDAVNDKYETKLESSKTLPTKEEFRLDLNWSIDEKGTSDKKFIFTVKTPEKKVRLVWEITQHESDRCLIDYSDWKGKVQDSEIGNVRTIIVAPDGEDFEIVVDPYLSVDEQATYIQVLCDGYYLKFYLNGSYQYVLILDLDGLTIRLRDYCNTYHDTDEASGIAAVGLTAEDFKRKRGIESLAEGIGKEEM